MYLTTPYPIQSAFAQVLLLLFWLGSSPVWAAPNAPNTPPSKQTEAERLKALERRISQLEFESAAKDDAIRHIIQDAISSSGSNINQAVSLNGSFELQAGYAQSLNSASQQPLILSTAELQLEIEANRWSHGSFTLSADSSANGAPQLQLDQAWFSLGDASRFPASLGLGRNKLGFGVGSDNTLAEVALLQDSLGAEAFGFKQTQIRIDYNAPLAKTERYLEPVIQPPLRSVLFKPLLSHWLEQLGYREQPGPASELPQLYGHSRAPRLNLAAFVYDGGSRQTGQAESFKLTQHYGLSLSYRGFADCPRPYEQISTADRCPSAYTLQLQWLRSLYDSEFLQQNYSDFGQQIGLVQGYSINGKWQRGPWLWQAEWIAALQSRQIQSALETRQLRPATLQIATLYQLDWNPWVPQLAQQGSYLSVSLSRSHDLDGVLQLDNGAPQRLGELPRTRLQLGAGEWLLPHLKLAVEYAYEQDYGTAQGGSGTHANSVLLSLAIDW